MKWSGLLSAALWFFVTDCDKTLVFYDEHLANEPMIKLPASSTGMTGYISPETLTHLDEISLDAPIVCVSGMRTSTMLQRQKYFPMVNHWITENGGRIFERGNVGGKSVFVENEEYIKYVDDSITAKEWAIFNQFAEKLSDEGFDVDREDYKTMFRIKRNKYDDDNDNDNKSDGILTLASLEEQIPPELTFTYNLGHLDVQVRGLGKYASVNWLISHLTGGSSIGGAKPLTKGRNGKNGEIDYIFMGDDDNDLEIASKARHAYIANPMSTSMSTFVEGEMALVKENKDKVSRPHSLLVAPQEGHAGSSALLKKVIEKIRELNSDGLSSGEL